MVSRLEDFRWPVLSGCQRRPLASTSTSYEVRTYSVLRITTWTLINSTTITATLFHSRRKIHFPLLHRLSPFFRSISIVFRVSNYIVQRPSPPRVKSLLLGRSSSTLTLRRLARIVRRLFPPVGLGHGCSVHRRILLDNGNREGVCRVGFENIETRHFDVV